MLNSQGQWQRIPPLEDRRLGEIQILEPASDGEIPARRSVLTEVSALEKVGQGDLLTLANGQYGRSMKLAERQTEDLVNMNKWVRRVTRWHGRQIPLKEWRDKAVPMIEQHLALQGFPVVRVVEEPYQILALIRLGEQMAKVPVDEAGIPLWHPPHREVVPEDCARCNLVPVCRQLTAATGTALLWRRLELVEAGGKPTLRGRIVSFFHGGDGLAIAAAVEDSTYPMDELVYDLANLDAGFRFCGPEDRWAGRLAMVCRSRYGNQSIIGYLENGVPPKYGCGAEVVVRSVHKDPFSKHRFSTDFLGDGDIDRIIIEWRSLLRQIAHAATLPMERWTQLQRAAQELLRETESPTVTDLPPLEYLQTRRIDHQILLRRH
jgi:hypothetical protein